MKLNPNPEVAKKLKAEGISYNAFLVPFLNDIAAGRLVRVPHHPAASQQKTAWHGNKNLTA